MNRRPSIAFVLTTLAVGGAEGQFAKLALALHTRGYRVDMVCLQQETAAVRQLRAAGLPVHVLGAGQGAMALRIWALVRGVVEMVRRWRRDRPDIVHGVLLHGYLTGAVSAWLAGVPVFVSSRRSLGLFKAGRPLLLRLERLVNRHTTLVIANSKAVRLDALRREALPEDRVEVIYNGLSGSPGPLDSRRVVRKSLGVLEDARVAIVVANFIHYKGHDMMINAWKRVTARVPGACLWLVGDGEERDYIAHLIETLDVSPSVRLLGSRADVPCLLHAADLLVHPSQQEGFSNAILEGMASGLPVVATDAGGNAEAVQHEHSGVLVPVDDELAMAEAVTRLLTDVDLAARFGEAGRQRVASCFSEERMVEAYDTMYRRLLDRTRPAAQARM